MTNPVDKVDTNEEELAEPPLDDAQNQSKLIGYGLFSLVFHPPIVMPDRSLFPDVADTIQNNPSRFVGLLTTYDQYQNKIRNTAGLLKKLSSKNSHLSNLIVFHVPLSPQEDFVLLQNEQIQKLVEAYHAVRKRVEYEGTWKDKDLIQLIYPYAGNPLEKFYKNSRNGPGWTEFFQGMAEVGRFLIALHREGYVHGDLSPNNLLYRQGDRKKPKITVVDWNMLSTAEDFLQQRKGSKRVGCWSPEHFSLTTSRLQNFDENRHWLIYAEEMQKYIERLLDFSFSGRSNRSTAIHQYFEPYTNEQKHPIFHTMYTDLKILSGNNPAAIGKYHDIRYFMDTIAKCVSGIFPKKTEAQQNQYKSFIAFYLSQNLPDRRIYLENPDLLANRLSLILEACQNAGSETTDVGAMVEAEQTLMNLLQ